MVELSPNVGQSPQILRFLFHVTIYHMENISLGKGSCRDPLGRAAHWLQNEGN